MSHLTQPSANFLPSANPQLSDPSKGRGFPQPSLHGKPRDGQAAASTILAVNQQISRSNTHTGDVKQLQDEMAANAGDKMLALHQLPNKYTMSKIAKGTVSSEAAPGRQSGGRTTQMLVGPISPISHPQPASNIEFAHQMSSIKKNAGGHKVAIGSAGNAANNNHNKLQKSLKSTTIRSNDLQLSILQRDRVEGRRAPSHEPQPASDPNSSSMKKDNKLQYNQVPRRQLISGNNTSKSTQPAVPFTHTNNMTNTKNSGHHVSRNQKLNHQGVNKFVGQNLTSNSQHNQQVLRSSKNATIPSMLPPQATGTTHDNQMNLLHTSTIVASNQNFPDIRKSHQMEQKRQTIGVIEQQQTSQYTGILSATNAPGRQSNFSDNITGGYTGHHPPSTQAKSIQNKYSDSYAQPQANHFAKSNKSRTNRRNNHLEIHQNAPGNFGTTMFQNETLSTSLGGRLIIAQNQNPQMSGGKPPSSLQPSHPGGLPVASQFSLDHVDQHHQGRSQQMANLQQHNNLAGGPAVLGSAAGRVLSGTSSKFKTNRIRSVNNNIEGALKGSLNHDYQYQGSIVGAKGGLNNQGANGSIQGSKQLNPRSTQLSQLGVQQLAPTGPPGQSQQTTKLSLTNHSLQSRERKNSQGIIGSSGGGSIQLSTKQGHQPDRYPYQSQKMYPAKGNKLQDGVTESHQNFPSNVLISGQDAIDQIKYGSQGQSKHGSINLPDGNPSGHSKQRNTNLKPQVNSDFYSRQGQYTVGSIVTGAGQMRPQMAHSSNKVSSATRSSKGTKLPSSINTMPYNSRKNPGGGLRGPSNLNFTNNGGGSSNQRSQHRQPNTNNISTSKDNFRVSSHSAISARSNKSAVSQKSGKSGKSGVSRHSTPISNNSQRQTSRQQKYQESQKKVQGTTAVYQGGYQGRRPIPLESQQQQRNSINQIIEKRKSPSRGTPNKVTSTSKRNLDHQGRRLSSPRPESNANQQAQRQPRNYGVNDRVPSNQARSQKSSTNQKYNSITMQQRNNHQAVGLQIARNSRQMIGGDNLSRLERNFFSERATSGNKSKADSQISNTLNFRPSSSKILKRADQSPSKVKPDSRGEHQLTSKQDLNAQPQKDNFGRNRSIQHRNRTQLDKFAANYGFGKVSAGGDNSSNTQASTAHDQMMKKNGQNLILNKYFSTTQASAMSQLGQFQQNDQQDDRGIHRPSGGDKRTTSSDIQMQGFATAPKSSRQMNNQNAGNASSRIENSQGKEMGKMNFEGDHSDSSLNKRKKSAMRQSPLQTEPNNNNNDTDLLLQNQVGSLKTQSNRDIFPADDEQQQKGGFQIKQKSRNPNVGVASGVGMNSAEKALFNSNKEQVISPFKDYSQQFINQLAPERHNNNSMAPSSVPSAPSLDDASKNSANLENLRKQLSISGGAGTGETRNNQQPPSELQQYPSRPSNNNDRNSQRMSTAQIESEQKQRSLPDKSGNFCKVIQEVEREGQQQYLNFKNDLNPIQNIIEAQLKGLIQGGNFLIGPGGLATDNFNPLKDFEDAKYASKSHGLITSYAANTHQGIQRNYNEDRVSIILNITRPENKDPATWPKCSFFAIYDGHGGSSCADFLKDHLHSIIITQPCFPQDPYKALKDGCRIAEERFIKIADKGSLFDKSGSCAIIVLTVETECFIANVGDSRAIMSSENGMKVYELSQDHRPNEEAEFYRIQENGGQVYQTQTYQTIPVTNQYGQVTGQQKQMLFGPYRVLPGRLSVARTFGDIEAKLEKFGGKRGVIIAEPEIAQFTIDENIHDFIVLGCDGIFDRLSSVNVLDSAWSAMNHAIKTQKEQQQQVHNKKQMTIHQITGKMADAILRSSAIERSFDNLTIVIITFKSLRVFYDKAMQQQPVKKQYLNISEQKNSANN